LSKYNFINDYCVHACVHACVHVYKIFDNKINDSILILIHIISIYFQIKKYNYFPKKTLYVTK